MSAGASLPGGSGKNQSQDFELNITSIIDTFTVLITFMLASASFLSIGLFDAGITAGGDSASSAKPPEVNVEVALSKDHTFEVKLTGKVTSNTKVPPTKTGDWDLDGLNAQLGGVKTKFAGVQAATLVAENLVEYKDVIRAMESTRKTLPYVLLGGF
jgi:biopolymer transport protein ExbD